jgi:hypothetical protein
MVMFYGRPRPNFVASGRKENELKFTVYVSTLSSIRQYVLFEFTQLCVAPGYLLRCITTNDVSPVFTMS